MTIDSRESVLSRWSRRKLESERTPQAVETSPPAELEGGQPAAPAESEAKPVLTDADMPDIDSLDENSDFSGFMSEGVSDELRNLALRKLFKAPVFNIRDGLDEYDEDYTYFEKLGDIVTCDMKHQIEMKEQKLREALQQEAEADDDGELDALEVIDEDMDEDEAQSETLAAAEQVDTQQEQDDPQQEPDNEQ